MVRGETEGLFVTTSIKRTLTSHWACHHTMSLGSHRVVDKGREEIQGVHHVPGPRIMDLQMQMGSRAMTGIPADGNQLSLSDREVKRSKVKVYLLVTPPGAMHHPLQLGRELLQVAIDTGITFRMGDIDRIAKAVDTYGETTHITVTNRVDVLTFHIISLDI